ncbi:hypothetical protein GW17_00035917 [Ensete ventricosum]|nr:hypothetical protein GW17_00035917 [Ensete ventricosum]
MRLNCVESFYAFLLRFYSEGNEEEGRPATSSPHAGLATHGQAGCAQGPLQWAAASMRGCPRAWLAPAGVGSTCGQATRDNRPRQGRKGQPPAARPQGVAARCEAARGSLAARAAAYKGGRSFTGSARARRHRPCKATPPDREVSPEGSSACHKGGCPR